jgi:hypothetical protein
MYKCALCGKELEIPPDAIQLGRAMGCRVLYRFGDGTLHDLYSTAVGNKKKSKGDEINGIPNKN